MNYRNYEDYMRQVLGYCPYETEPNNTYMQNQGCPYNYYDDLEPTQPSVDLTAFYPEIYKMIYPMVCKVCNVNSSRELTKELLEQMTDEIYRNIEPEDTQNSNQRTQAPLKNGDVRNPNSKEIEKPLKDTRQINYLLRDLITILILKEWGRPNRPPVRPPFPPNPRPPMGPGGRPPMEPPPPPRPRYF